MIDTGGTLAKAADLMMEKGALSVRQYLYSPSYRRCYEKMKNQLLELILPIHPLKKESKNKSA
jgi:ribose-phosphate pyrophosphokinase